jgi:hypothetical protein
MDDGHSLLVMVPYNEKKAFIVRDSDGDHARGGQAILLCLKQLMHKL